MAGRWTGEVYDVAPLIGAIEVAVNRPFAHYVTRKARAREVEGRLIVDLKGLEVIIDMVVVYEGLIRRAMGKGVLDLVTPLTDAARAKLERLKAGPREPPADGARPGIARRRAGGVEEASLSVAGGDHAILEPAGEPVAAGVVVYLEGGAGNLVQLFRAASLKPALLKISFFANGVLYDVSIAVGRDGKPIAARVVEGVNGARVYGIEALRLITGFKGVAIVYVYRLFQEGEKASPDAGTA